MINPADYSLPEVDPSTMDIPADVLRLLPLTLVRRHGLMPIAVTDSTLTIAMRDPGNLVAINEVRFLTGYDLRVTVATPAAIAAAIIRHYVGH